ARPRVRPSDERAVAIEMMRVGHRIRGEPGFAHEVERHAGTAVNELRAELDRSMERACAAADAVRRLEQLDGDTMGGKLARRSKPSETRTDDRDVTARHGASTRARAAPCAIAVEAARNSGAPTGIRGRQPSVQAAKTKHPGRTTYATTNHDPASDPGALRDCR